MKAMRFLLKLSGVILIVLGAVCLVAGFFDKIRALFPTKQTHKEFDDYADVG
ncbi:MAG: hypothetical protein IJ980_02300 [Oscillospiraceae bacterium]|nr:hypothetical protein [Oscillospiraceae bacterium]